MLTSPLSFLGFLLPLSGALCFHNERCNKSSSLHLRGIRSFSAFQGHQRHNYNNQRITVLHQSNSNDDSSSPTARNDDIPPQIFGPTRRSFLSSLLVPTSGIVSGNSLTNTKPVFAKPGLVQFPCKNGLGNTYHLMRVGESLLEAEDVWSTNPLFLTNREAALSPLGVEQVEDACRYMKQNDVTVTFVKYSLAASCTDTADIVGRDLQIGRDRLVPEFTFMDPRAIGMWDMSTLSVTEPAVWALDVDDAGVNGFGGRPPPNVDGTPNETLSNQVIRLRQLLSVLETSYSGDNLLLIFPDGTTPAVLTALIGGMPLNRVHEINFKPGEVRLNVSYNSARLQLPSPTDPDAQSTDEAYLEKIKIGREELEKLRNNPDEVINVKDLKYEEELRQEEEKATAAAKLKAEREAEKEAARIAKLEADRLRKEEELKAKKEEEKARLEKREAEKLEKAERLNEARQKEEKARKAKLEAERIRKEMALTEKQRQSPEYAESDSGDNVVVSTLSAIGILGAIGFAATMDEDDIEDAVNQLDRNQTSAPSAVPDAANVTETKLEILNNTDRHEVPSIIHEKVTVEDSLSDDESRGNLDFEEEILSNTTESTTELNSETNNNNITSRSNGTVVSEQNASIQDKNKNETGVNGVSLATTVKENGEKENAIKSSDLFLNTIASKNSISNGGGLYGDDLIEDNPEKRAIDAMEEYMNKDDGGDAWLGMLADLVEEDNDEETVD